MSEPAAEPRRKIPWVFLAGGLLALALQLRPGWREVAIYDRAAVAAGELWRMWSGHWVHFGWPHFVVDAGLFLILGWMLERDHRRFAYAALLAMPVLVSAFLFVFDPSMPRYGGLSAVNLGLLVYLALQGWQRNWRDAFWPAVLLIYVAELVFEIVQGGRGGGFIAFDDPTIRIATSAHVAAGLYGVAAWVAQRARRART